MEKLRTKILPAVYTGFLYLLTLVLGLWDIYLLREIFLVIYAQFSYEVALASTLGMVVVLILALVYLGFVLITFEYHRKYFGQTESWRLFTQTLIVQIIIPIIAFFMKVEF
jgi:hypothetical protein